MWVQYDMRPCIFVSMILILTNKNRSYMKKKSKFSIPPQGISVERMFFF